MKNEITEIAFILDRSGSMDSMRAEAIGGFNAFVDAQKKELGQARLSLILFDHEYSPTVTSIPIEEMPELTEREYVPRGTTALLDAMGRTIDELGQRLAEMPENERPGHVIVVTLTDGLENASSDFTYETVGKRIKHQRETYNWEFVFLAGDLETIQAAERMHVPRADTVLFRKSPEGMHDSHAQASFLVSEKRARQRSRRPQ